MMAQMPEIAEKAQAARYLRTKSKNHVSKATILEYIRKHFFRLLLLNPKSGLTRIIKGVQERYSDGNEMDMAG